LQRARIADKEPIVQWCGPISKSDIYPVKLCLLLVVRNHWNWL